MQSNPIQKQLLIAAAISLFLLFSTTFTESYGNKKSGDDEPSLKIHVQSAETILVNGERTGLSQLQPILKKIGEENVNLQTLQLQIDPDVKMGVVDAVQEVLRELSILRVSYSLDSGEIHKLILPQKGNEELMKKIPQKNISAVNIDPQGELSVDNEKMSRERFRDHLKKRLENSPNLIVNVTFSGETKIEDYIVVLDDLKAAGVARISLNGPTLRSWTIQKYK